MANTRPELIAELVVSTEGKTNCQRWNSDDWGGYERVLPPEILHYVGKDKTQRLERINGTIRQQTGRWHRRQNALWEIVGANQSGSAISSELLQLVWAA